MFSSPKIPVVSKEEMIKIDQTATNHFGLNTEMLMENAGRNVATFARQILKNLKGKQIIIMAGRGHNGGDGLVAARFLSNWGAKVSCVITEHPDFLDKLTKHHVGILKSMYVDTYHSTNQMALPTLFKNADLIIDALIGFNLEDNPKNFYATLINMANESKKKVLAVDIPTGLNADTGEAMNPCIKATYTITFALPKKGLLEKHAKQYAGEIWVCDIGIPHEVYEYLSMPVTKIFGEKDIIKI